MLERSHLEVRAFRLGLDMASSRPAGHRQLDHTADLALEVWGRDEVEVLREALRAVIEILTEHGSVERRDERVVEVDALDGADRLVRWINEILYLATVEGFVAADALVTLRDGGLGATLVGEANGGHRLRTEIKSATYHDLLLERRGSEVIARVVMDV